MSSEDRDASEKRDHLRAYWSGLDLLWDAEIGASAETPRRRRGLDFTQIVRAGIDLADAEGLDAVTMRRVASKLDTGAMSLYRHVPDKDALVLMMIDATLAAADRETPFPAASTWREALEALAGATWTIMRRHTWLPEAMLIRPPLTPRGAAGLEAALSIFDPFEIDIGTKMQFVTAVHFTVLSAALNAQIEDRTRARLQASDQEIESSASHVITRIAETGEYPRVIRFIVEAAHLDEKSQMLAAVALVIDGIGARLDAIVSPADAGA